MTAQPGNENHALDPQAYEEYKSRSTRFKFLGQLMAALAGGSFLAVLNTVGNSLIVVAAKAAVINWPVALVMAGCGIAATYLSCRYFQKAQMLDSDFNAKNNAQKIAAATGRGKDSPETQVAVAVEQEVGREKPKNFPLPAQSAQAAPAAAMAEAPESQLEEPPAASLLISTPPESAPKTSISGDKMLDTMTRLRSAARDQAREDAEPQPAMARG